MSPAKLVYSNSPLAPTTLLEHNRELRFVFKKVRLTFCDFLSLTSLKYTATFVSIPCPSLVRSRTKK